MKTGCTAQEAASFLFRDTGLSEWQTGFLAVALDEVAEWHERIGKTGSIACHECADELTQMSLLLGVGQKLLAVVKPAAASQTTLPDYGASSSMSAENAEQTVVTAARKTRAQRQPQTIHSLVTKAAQLEDAAYGRLLERADVKEALFRLESAQAKRDSVSRKLCAGSAAVTVGDFSRWEAELVDAKAALLKLAEHTPILMKHPALATH